jgi:leucyl aminopeptidase
MPLPFVDRSPSSLPVHFVGQAKWRNWLRDQSAARRGWIESSGVSGKAGDLALLPGRDGRASGAVLVLSP